ncbi:ankyrin repeat protein, partial [Pyronema omphalodes]
IIKLLLGYGADANGLDMKFDTPLSLATYSDWGKNMKCLVRMLLEFGAKLTINDGGTIHNRPPLLWAARHGDVEVVGILLKYGADTSVVDGHGFTAFQLAKQEGHKKVMKLL